MRARARRPKRLDGAPRGGRWARRVTGRKERTGTPYGAILLAAIAIVVVGALAAWGWLLDQHLRDGLLAQRQEAAKRADWVPLRSLPPYVPAAFLAVTDRSFLERQPAHFTTEEATLPRELVRQVYLLPPSLGGRGRELFMAPLLEQRLTKRATLELYLNRVHLGEDEGWPIYGVYHAAREYFDKDPESLTLAEAATLAGLLLPPRIADPEREPGAVGARRNEVLRHLLTEGIITPDDYQAAVEEPLRFQPGPDYAPMTRPRDWSQDPEIIRVQQNPAADSLEG